jgi:phenylacetate-CoA ligase
MTMIGKDMLLLGLLDFVKGTNVSSWYKFYRKSLLWDAGKIEQYRIKRLRQLLVHARQTTSYYAEILGGLNIDNIASIDDLGEIPLLDRELIQTNKHKLISTAYPVKKLIKGSSSGTTGIPIQYFMDRNGMSAGVAAGYLLWSMSGWNFGQRNVHIWGNQSSIERWNTLASKLKNRLMNQKNIASTLLNDTKLIEEIAQRILKFKPMSIEGYSSSIYTLAKYFKENNLRLDAVKHVLTTAENLEEYQKELIEDVFAPAGDLYGSGEVQGIATKPVGESKYYILDLHVLVETVESGIKGMYEILLTDLDNYAMPLIRYKIGDMTDAIQPPAPGAKYPFTWFTRIHGRNSDIITLPNGKKFHPVNIFGGTLFRNFDNIIRHKVVWNGQILHFIFEVSSFRQDEAIRHALSSLLQTYDVDFTVEYTQQILPSAGGKYKYFEILKETNQ